MFSVYTMILIIMMNSYMHAECYACMTLIVLAKYF